VGKIRVFSIKVALATMCAGKLMDKLRCKYSIVSDLLFDNVQQTYTGSLTLVLWKCIYVSEQVLSRPGNCYSLSLLSLSVSVQ